jgi:hypothetical protein
VPIGRDVVPLLPIPGHLRSMPLQSVRQEVLGLPNLGCCHGSRAAAAAAAVTEIDLDRVCVSVCVRRSRSAPKSSARTPASCLAFNKLLILVLLVRERSGRVRPGQLSFTTQTSPSVVDDDSPHPPQKKHWNFSCRVILARAVLTPLASLLSLLSLSALSARPSLGRGAVSGPAAVTTRGVRARGVDVAVNQCMPLGFCWTVGNCARAATSGFDHPSHPPSFFLPGPKAANQRSKGRSIDAHRGRLRQSSHRIHN